MAFCVCCTARETHERSGACSHRECACLCTPSITHTSPHPPTPHTHAPIHPPSHRHSTPQAFKQFNTAADAELQEFLAAIAPFKNAVAPVIDVAEDIAGVLNVVQDIVDNAIFKEIIAGLEFFNTLLVTRVKFTIDLGEFCLWSKLQAAVEIMT